MFKKFCTSLFINLFPVLLFSQSNKIQGIVYDSITRKPLSGVAVSFSNNKGTITNDQGYFILLSQFFSLNKKNKLSVSYVGYKSIDLNVEASKEMKEIYLAPAQRELKEIIIFSKTKSIIEKAIAKIPINYPIIPISITGLMRVNTSINDTDYFYKSDAVIKVYAPTYQNGSTQKVKVLQNKTISVKNPRSKYYHLAPATIGGNFSSISDVVYHRDIFLDKSSIDDYLFIQRDKIKLNNRITYVIDFERKKKNKIEGTVYIDSSSLAFVEFNIKTYQVKSLAFVTKDFVRSQIKYDTLGDRWVISRSNIEYVYNKSIIAKEYVDFSAIQYDTNEVKAITSFESVSSFELDDNIKQFVPDSIWKKNDSLFVQAENTGKISLVEVPYIDTTIKPQKNLQASFAKYLNNQNLSIRIYGSQNPFSIKNTMYSQITGYSIGTGIMLRIYKSVFFLLNAENSWGLGSLDNRIRSYQLSFQPKLFAVSFKSMIPALYIGYTRTAISDKEKGIQESLANIVAGLSIYLPISKRLQLFTEGEYLQKLKQKESTLGIIPKTFSFKAGFTIKF